MNYPCGALFSSFYDVFKRPTLGVLDVGFFVFVKGKNLFIDINAVIAGCALWSVNPG